jgi:hypothetical protein
MKTGFKVGKTDVKKMEKTKDAMKARETAGKTSSRWMRRMTIRENKRTKKR